MMSLKHYHVKCINKMSFISVKDDAKDKRKLIKKEFKKNETKNKKKRQRNML